MSIQLKMSQLNDLGDVGGAAALGADHDPWPGHVKKSKAHGGRRNSHRRQSILTSNLLQYNQTDQPSHDLPTGANWEERRRSSLPARRGSLFPAELAPECPPKRRHSLLPVLRAASKGEEVKVINGTKSLEAGDTSVDHQSSLRMSSSRSAAQKREDGREMTSGRSEKVADMVRRQSSKFLTASSSRALLKRRSTISLKEGMISDVSQEFSQSGKLEDQINLQHLVELMTVFNVSCARL